MPQPQHLNQAEQLKQLAEIAGRAQRAEDARAIEAQRATAQPVLSPVIIQPTKG